jgi:hypothetical protein
MRMASDRRARLFIVGLTCVLATLMSSTSFAQQQPVSTSVPPADQVQPVKPAELPDSPGALYSQNLAQDQGIQQQQQPQTQPPPHQDSQPAQSPNQPPTTQQTQSGAPHQPVGTAAARSATPTGVAASEPAGYAIAPAKQKRVRTILISMGAVLGAGAALGAVAALSAGSPSRPPNAH